MNEKNILRIIDANLNRLCEGLRVCEEVARFILEDKRYTSTLKRLRHDAIAAAGRSGSLRYASLVGSRDSKSDVGKDSIPQELKRANHISVLCANLQRVKESSRVLEEFSKIIDRQAALRFKKIRFKIYDTEKDLIERAESLRNNR